MPATRVRAARIHPVQPRPVSAADDVSALVARAQAGDAEAFGLVYDRYVDQVFRFVYRRVLDRQVAEDLTSETFCGRCATWPASAGRAATSAPG